MIELLRSRERKKKTWPGTEQKTRIKMASLFYFTLYSSRETWVSESESVRIFRYLKVSEFLVSDTFRFERILTPSGYKNFWHIQILILSGSENFVIPWHSDTFRFQKILTLSGSNPFSFWHFQDWNKIGKNWDSDTFSPPFFSAWLVNQTNNVLWIATTDLDSS